MATHLGSVPREELFHGRVAHGHANGRRWPHLQRPPVNVHDLARVRQQRPAEAPWGSSGGRKRRGGEGRGAHGGGGSKGARGVGKSFAAHARGIVTARTRQKERRGPAGELQTCDDWEANAEVLEEEGTQMAPNLARRVVRREELVLAETHHGHLAAAIRQWKKRVRRMGNKRERF